MSYAAPFATWGASERPRGYLAPAPWSFCKGYGKLLSDVTILDGQTPFQSFSRCESARFETTKRLEMRKFHLQRSIFGEPLEDFYDSETGMAKPAFFVQGSALRAASCAPTGQAASGRRRAPSSGSTMTPGSHDSFCFGSSSPERDHLGRGETPERQRSQEESLPQCRSPSRGSRSWLSAGSSPHHTHGRNTDTGGVTFSSVEMCLGSRDMGEQWRGESPAVTRRTHERSSSGLRLLRAASPVERAPLQMARSGSLPLGGRLSPLPSAGPSAISALLAVGRP